MNSTINATVATPVPLSSMTDAQLCELHDRLGDKGMEALIVAEEEKQARQEAAAEQAPPRVKTLDERREDLAARCGKEFPHVADALWGMMPFGASIKVLNGALKNRAFGPEAADTLECVRDLAIKAEVRERKEALARRETLVTAQATKVRAIESRFLACSQNGNIGGMEAALREFRNAELQAGLIRHAGGTPADRDRLLEGMSMMLVLAKATKAKAAKEGRKK